MRTFLLIFITFCTFQVQAQLSTDELNAIFTRISEKDQSHLGKDSTDKSIRQNMFVENFDTIKYLLQTHQLVGIKERLSKKQYRNYEGAIGITFTHIWQIYPALILNDDFIAFLKQEIDAKRFDISVLFYPCSYAIYKNPYYEHPLSMEKKLYEAFDAWGIDRSKLFTGK
jgi:hypothetical protein